MLTFKICVGVFSETFKARMLKLCIHMDNELLYSVIENRTLALILLFIRPFFSLLRLICVPVFSGTVQARIFKYGIHM